MVSNKDCVFFSNIPIIDLPADLIGYRKMWRAVLDRVVEDILSEPTTMKGRMAQHEARFFAEGGKKMNDPQSGLSYVTDLAGLPYKWTKQKIQELTHEH